ncbi:hypothetical protein ACFX14_021796 [Malus domestica]
MERWDIKSHPKNRDGRSYGHSRDNPSLSDECKFLMNASSSSSDSSGGFSSSKSDIMYRSKSRSSSPCYVMHRL